MRNPWARGGGRLHAWGWESHSEMDGLAVASPSKRVGQLEAEDFRLKPQGQSVYGKKPSSQF